MNLKGVKYVYRVNESEGILLKYKLCVCNLLEYGRLSANYSNYR